MTITHTFLLGDNTHTFTTGEIAKQASGAVELCVLDTVVLATTVVSGRSKPELGFVPLTVDYAEKAYAAGRIPGGHLKREGLPPDHVTRVARRIDRAIRPLFRDDFRHETQVVVQVLSAQPEVATDILATIAASASLALTGIELHDYVASVRVNCVDDRFIVNPSADITTIRLDWIYAACCTCEICQHGCTERNAECCSGVGL